MGYAAEQHMAAWFGFNTGTMSEGAAQRLAAAQEAAAIKAAEDQRIAANLAGPHSAAADAEVLFQAGITPRSAACVGALMLERR